MNNNLKFGQFISEKRLKLSLKSQELAKALGISNAYLSQLEKGIRTHPSAKLLDKIANSQNRNDFCSFIYSVLH